MKFKYCLRTATVLAAMLAGTSLQAQLRVLSVERLALPVGQHASRPLFAPDGRSVFFTKEDFNGIWQHEFASATTKQISADPRSGYGFAVSEDGRSIAYRTTLDETPAERKQELVLYDLPSGKRSVVERGSDLQVPRFAGSALVRGDAETATALSKGEGAAVVVRGIENTKIALGVGGKKVLLDPLTDGSYIWPALSPDKKLLVAYEMDRGAFVCDLQGKVLVRLGKRDAPVWTRSGKWIVYIDDRDDGHRLVASDLKAVASDGQTTVQLTNTPSVLEMYPTCSPVDDSICFETPEGDLYLMRYEEAAQ